MQTFAAWLIEADMSRIAAVMVRIRGLAVPLPRRESHAQQLSRQMILHC